MDHNKKCNLLVDTFKKLGFTEFFLQSRGDGGRPSNCNSLYLFYPNPRMQSYNYQMYRGYVHDTEDIIYLRINIPGIKYGLGKEPLQLDPNHNQFAEQVIEFCQGVTLSKNAVEQLLEEFRMRQGSNKKTKKVICDLCKGTKIDLHRQRVYPDHPPLECKLCEGKLVRFLVTETYYVYK